MEENIKQKILAEIYRGPNTPVETQAKSRVKTWRIALGITAFVAISAGAVSLVQRYIAQSTVTYMLPIALKTISKKGSPLAGVQVGIDKTLYGKTDSFGDWQGFVPLKGGAESLEFRLIKKTPEGRYFKSLAKAIATDNLAGMPLKFNVALPFKAKARKAKNLTAYGDSHVALIFAGDAPKGGSRRLAKASEAFRLKTLPEIVRKLSHVGITAEQGSPWRVTFTVVPRPSGAPLLVAEQTLRGKTTRFMTSLSGPFHQVARRVIAMMKKTAERRYYFAPKPFGLALGGISQMPEFWWPEVGDRFTSRAAKAKPAVTRLALLDTGAADKVLGLAKAPCQKRRCAFTRLAGYAGPAAGRQGSFALKVVTPKPAATAVYINGIEVPRKRGGYYRYHGLPQGRSFVAILVSGRYYGGYKINHRLKQVPVISVSPRAKAVASKRPARKASRR